MAEELYRKSAFELAAMIRARQLKPSELIDSMRLFAEQVMPYFNSGS